MKSGHACSQGAPVPRSFTRNACRAPKDPASIAAPGDEGGGRMLQPSFQPQGLSIHLLQPSFQFSIQVMQPSFQPQQHCRT